MSSLIGSFLKGVFTGDQIKDWDHASRLFVANSYELAPKGTWSFHVFFDLSSAVASKDLSIKQIELGMLVKEAQLPQFDVETKTLNAYNRNNVHQTHIKYAPVNITFHDDAADVVKKFWFDYYNYYYRDSDNSEMMFKSSHDEFVNARQNDRWGYTLRNDSAAKRAEPYLTAIRIYSLNNKKFSEYTLLNPLIKSFRHGTHNSSSTTDTMSNTMTVEYEGVIYKTGWVGEGSVKGFGQLHYDNRPSPLKTAGGGTSSIFGQGGIVQSGSEIFSDLSDGNFGSALFKAGRFGTQLKGANVQAMALNESLKMGKDIISSAGTKAGFSFPSAGSLLNKSSSSPTSAFGGSSGGVVNIFIGGLLKNISKMAGNSKVTSDTGNTAATEQDASREGDSGPSDDVRTPSETPTNTAQGTNGDAPAKAQKFADYNDTKVMYLDPNDPKNGAVNAQYIRQGYAKDISEKPN